MAKRPRKLQTKPKGRKFTRLDGCSAAFRKIDAALKRNGADGFSLAVVLPSFPVTDGLKLTESELTVHDSVRRYLASVGVQRIKVRLKHDPRPEACLEGWTCGCLVRMRYFAGGSWSAMAFIACPRHRGALLGRDPKTGEYGDSHATREYAHINLTEQENELPELSLDDEDVA